MADSTLGNLTGQDPSRQVMPVVFRWLTEFGIGNSSQPGQWSPLLAGPNGAVYVQFAGGTTSLTPLETLDLAEFTYSPTAGELGLIGISLLWGWDEDNEEYIRAQVLRESGNWNGEAALAVAATLYRYDDNLEEFSVIEGNVRTLIFSSAARTATTISAEQNNLNFRGLHLIVDVTAIVTAPSIVVNIEAQDETSSVWYPLLISAAITAVGTTVLKIGPGYTPVANLTANDNLPYLWRVNIVHANADSITYSVGASQFVQ